MILSSRVTGIECYSSDFNSCWLKWFSILFYCIHSFEKERKRTNYLFRWRKPESTFNSFVTRIFGRYCSVAFCSSINKMNTEFLIWNLNLKLIASFVWSRCCVIQQNPPRKRQKKNCHIINIPFICCEHLAQAPFFVTKFELIPTNGIDPILTLIRRTRLHGKWVRFWAFSISTKHINTCCLWHLTVFTTFVLTLSVCMCVCVCVCE